MNNRYKFIWIATLFFLYAIPLQAQEAASSRTILGLYDSTDDFNRAVDRNFIHNYAEMVLNHLGMKVLLHDVNAGLPSDETMAEIDGILAWFHDSDLANAEVCLQWLYKQAGSGKKLVLFKEAGIFRDRQSKEPVSTATMEALYRQMGVDFGNDWTDNGLVIEVVDKVPAMVEFERDLEFETGSYEKIGSRNTTNEVLLALRRTDVPGSESAVVTLSPQGGMALSEYVLFINYLDDSARWRINPFLYFQRAFALEGRPRFDATTLFGRRISYVHIDGDGLRNLSELNSRKTSGAIINKKILQKFRLPTSVSFVAAELDPAYLGSAMLVDLSREILELPYVETGVHGFSHPLDWRQQLVSFELAGYSKKGFLSDAEGRPLQTLYPDAAQAVADHDRFVDAEVREATETVNRLAAPADKLVENYHWSGNCRPTAEAIRMTRKLELFNMNGGDSRFDRASPTYTRVAPLTRQIEGEIQVYSSNMNENIYTREWTGPFGGFSQVIETFQQTEYPTLIQAPPRRVSPINIYYHFYSGEKAAALEALELVYQYVLDQETIPLFPSEYMKIVKGFFSASAEPVAQRGWRFSNYGAARTVRFDNETRYPDLIMSQGVLGYRRWENALYVHLADAEEALLHWTDEAPLQPFLEQAGNIVQELELSEEAINFRTHGYFKGMFVFQNMKPEAVYEVTSYDDNHLVMEEKRFRANSAGRLEIRITVEGHIRVEVKQV